MAKGLQKFIFLREYAHMCYGTMTVPALKSLGEAYVLTADRKYARAGCILMGCDCGWWMRGWRIRGRKSLT